MVAIQNRGESGLDKVHGRDGFILVSGCATKRKYVVTSNLHLKIGIAYHSMYLSVSAIFRLAGTVHIFAPRHLSPFLLEDHKNLQSRSNDRLWTIFVELVPSLLSLRKTAAGPFMGQ